MTLAQAQESIVNGASFGAVYPMMAAEPDGPTPDQIALKEWFVRDHRVPARPKPRSNGGPPTATAMLSAKAEQTGKFCRECGGCRIVRTGSCETCQDCGSNEGCG